MVDCDNCGYLYKPEASRWLCPECHYKGTCCEGEAQQVCIPVTKDLDTYN